MFKLEIENFRGEKLVINEAAGYAITGIDGLTAPKFNVNFTAAGLKDGSIYNSARSENRNIVITMRLIKNIEASRIRLYRFFSAKNKIRIYFKNDSRDVWIDGYLESLDGNLFENGQAAQISILCPNPYFNDSKESVGNISSIVSMFEFPFAISAAGIAFAKLEKLTEKNVINDGDVSTGIVIEMYANAAIEDPVMYDVDGNRFALNISLRSGDVVIIDTIPGEKSVKLIRGGVASNIIEVVASNPTWFELHTGDNLFTFDAASGSAQMDIVFRHYNQYLGV